MDNKTDTYKASMAELARQGREVAKEVDAFLNSDTSQMSKEEFDRTQQLLLAKQQNTIEAFAAAFGMNKTPTSTLMQSEDKDINDLKRLAGITEASENHNFDTMKKISQLAQNYMQNHKASSALTARNIIFLAQRIKDD